MGYEVKEMNEWEGRWGKDFQGTNNTKDFQTDTFT